MAISRGEKNYTTFVKGLITEAGPLTYPDNATIDEANFILSTKGDRRRRRGIDYEDGYVLQDYFVDTSTIGETVAVTCHRWDNAGGISSQAFVVVQVGTTLYFYDSSSEALSAGLESFTVDLTPYQSAINVGSLPIDVSVGKGALFVTNARMNPIAIRYDEVSDDITVSEITIEVRDFEGVTDGLAVNENPSTLTAEHRYNLYNQGWTNPDTTGTIDTYISQFFTSVSAYPSNAQVWYPGRVDTSTTLDIDNIINTQFGTTYSTRGHFILEAFDQQRSTVSGIAGLPDVTTPVRPSITAFHAGRVWFGGEKGNVYFSQAIHDNFDNIGRCYQEADPTIEDNNQIVATDGGVVKIPEAGEFIGMQVVGSSMVVIATNGVWSITGTDGGFKANDYGINRISDVGGFGPSSVIDVEGLPVWWSDAGIFSLEVSEVTQQPVLQDLTNTSIKTFYDAIPEKSKFNARGAYDRINKKVVWLYSREESDNDDFCDGVLTLDLTLSAFYPWTIDSSSEPDLPWLVGVVETTAVESLVQEEAITVGGVTVTVSGVPLVESVGARGAPKTTIKYLCIDPRGGTGNPDSGKLTFGEFFNTSFHDWVKGTAGNQGVDYSSYMITGYEIGGDPQRKKEIEYLTTYFMRTETGFTGNDDVGYTLDNPSSCLMQVYWDWTDNASAGRWSREVQAYRLPRLFTVDPSNLAYDNGEPVVVTKHKVRGRGRSLQFKFSSESGKDLHLLGWSAVYSTLTEV